MKILPLLLLLFCFSCQSPENKVPSLLNTDEHAAIQTSRVSSENFSPSNVDYSGFVQLALEVEGFRQKRLLKWVDFMNMAAKEGTVVLDTRSKDAYEKAHFEGAIHLNFSDFTEEKLKKLIPSNATRILIYCNNNFSAPIKTLEGDMMKLQLTEIKSAVLADKSVGLALNVPTFINLYGYGYKNIYELGELVPMDFAVKEFEGTMLTKLQ